MEKNADRATYRFTIRYRADSAAFGVFVQRLRQTLEKIALAQGGFTLKASRSNTHPEWGWVVGAGGNEDHFAQNLRPIREWLDAEMRGLPEASKLRPFFIALNVQRTRQFDRTVWRYYRLDPSARVPLAASAACIFSTKLTLVDSGGKLVADESFPAYIRSPVSREIMPITLIRPVYSAKDTLLAQILKFDTTGTIPTGFQADWFRRMETHDPWSPEEGLMLVAPMFFKTRSDFTGREDYYWDTLSVQREITLSLDEWKQVRNVRCELSFGGKLPPDAPPVVPPSR